MTEIEFAKYQGLGNDFAIVEDMDGSFALGPSQIAQMCHRHMGVGADGLLLVRPSRAADFRMTYYNADGGEAEMCGNGVRCLVKYLHDYRLSPKTSLDIETRAGIKHVEALTEDGIVTGVAVDMGHPDLSFAAAGMMAREGEAVEITLPTSRGDVIATCVSMGNPHCVLFGGDVETAPVAALGAELERSPLFGEGVNVEFAHVVSREELQVRVWERGIGETLACGTGACAAAVAAAKTGRTARKVKVELPGGVLDIYWTEDGTVMMTGPAAQVFTGMYYLAT